MGLAMEVKGQAANTCFALKQSLIWDCYSKPSSGLTFSLFFLFRTGLDLCSVLTGPDRTRTVCSRSAVASMPVHHCVRMREGGERRSRRRKRALYCAVCEFVIFPCGHKPLTCRSEATANIHCGTELHPLPALSPPLPPPPPPPPPPLPPLISMLFSALPLARSLALAAIKWAVPVGAVTCTAAAPARI